MKRTLLFSSFIVIVMISFQCGGEDSEDGNADSEILSEQNDKTFKFRKMLFSVPSPFHITDLIKEISSLYNYDLLNPSENSLNYSTSEKKALNLGIYTADMGYTNVYEQITHTSKYLKVVKALSSDLQIMNVYTEEILNDLELNLKNKDTLYKIFAEAYREADIYLTDNQRGDIAVLIITGAWTEGLYLMTQVCKENPNEQLINRIGEQKYSLENIIKLLVQYKNEQNQNFGLLIDNLNDLQSTFKKVDITYSYDKHIVMPNEKKTIILSNTKIDIDNETLEEITQKVKNLRAFITK